MLTLDAQTIDAGFGVIVDHIDLKEIDTLEKVKPLKDLFYKNRFMVARHQDLSPSDYAQFTRLWGEPMKFYWQEHIDKSVPEVIYHGNNADTPVHMRDGAVQWHSDNSYEPEPASMTFLYCLEAPLEGGMTMFADIVAAYEALDPELKAKVDTIQVRHRLLNAPAIDGETFIVPPAPTENTIEDHIRPAVMVHPVTGEKSLYMSGSAYGVVGMDEDEGRELVRELRRHLAQPRFQSHYTMEQGDLMWWDNFAVHHCATPIEYSDEDGKRRRLQRISLLGNL